VRRAPISVVAREWGRIGLTSFGGPPAQVAMLRELCVDRRRWIDAEEFEHANAATQLLPGPGGSQLAIYCAQRVGGNAGALVGGLAFILPGLVIVLAIAAVALGNSPPVWIRAVGAGAAAAVVAVVVQAGIALGRTSVVGRGVRAFLYLVAGAAATVAVGPGVVLVIVACGLVELAWRRRDAALAVSPVPLVLAIATLPALAWTALKVGALSYGGGFVIIPLMHGDAVDTYGWMTDTEFANAVAYGQLTPGPVVHTVAMVGWAAAGFGGAILAATLGFAPSFLMVYLFGDHFLALRESAPARAFLNGAGPAAVGAILGATVPLVQALQEWWQFAVLGVAAAALVTRLPPFWLLVGGAAGGLAAAAAGLAVP
jgi:chromate transporter